MTGVVFSNTIDVPLREDVAEIIIEKYKAPDPYIAISTYPISKIAQLIMAFTKETKIDPSNLVESFRFPIFGTHPKLYKSFLKNISKRIEYLENATGYLYCELLKMESKDISPS